VIFFNLTQEEKRQNTAYKNFIQNVIKDTNVLSQVMSFLGKLCMIPDQMQQSWTPIDKAFIEVQWAEKVMENEPGKVL